MTDDPANFYARLQSSIDADTRRERAALRPSDATACPPSENVDTAPEQWQSQCLVARIQRDEALNLLRRIARKGEFMDMEGQRLVVSDWLARRHISPENVCPLAPADNQTPTTQENV